MSRAGELGVERALERLRVFPFDAGPAATLDTQRELRTGFPEVILAERKSPEDVVSAFARLAGAAGLGSVPSGRNLAPARGRWPAGSGPEVSQCSTRSS